VNWALFRWVWQLEGPMHVGISPAGSLNRTRLYVPARALWGALTAELSRREAQDGEEPQYRTVGSSLQNECRFTYLFPAEEDDAGWRAWLPTYREEQGLVWSREDKPESLVGDRQFRRLLLSTRPSTAIEASTDAAADGSLRETECIETRWRNKHGHDAGPVAMVGYAFVETGKEQRPKVVDTLFVGGDTRYGLGRQRCIACEPATAVFGASVGLMGPQSPTVKSLTAWAHAWSDAPVHGSLELLGGWDHGSIRDLARSAPLWQPGSGATNALSWTIDPDGIWGSVRD
jgi:hypothetical protein